MKITGTQNKRKNQYSFLLQEKGIGFSVCSMMNGVMNRPLTCAYLINLPYTVTDILQRLLSRKFLKAKRC